MFVSQTIDKSSQEYFMKPTQLLRRDISSTAMNNKLSSSHKLDDPGSNDSERDECAAVPEYPRTSTESLTKPAFGIVRNLNVKPDPRIAWQRVHPPERSRE
jgi:hypothetical protein